jgi:hypothetical protein
VGEAPVYSRPLLAMARMPAAGQASAQAITRGSNPRGLTVPNEVFFSQTGQEFPVVLAARPIGGSPTPSDESTGVRWVPSSEVRSYGMDRSMRLRIEHYLEWRKSPAIT